MSFSKEHWVFFSFVSQEQSLSFFIKASSALCAQGLGTLDLLWAAFGAPLDLACSVVHSLHWLFWGLLLLLWAGLGICSLHSSPQ